MGPENGRSSFTLTWVLIVRAHRFISAPRRISNLFTVTPRASVHLQKMSCRGSSSLGGRAATEWRSVFWFDREEGGERGGGAGVIQPRTGSSPTWEIWLLHVLGASSEFRYAIEQFFFLRIFLDTWNIFNVKFELKNFLKLITLFQSTQ